MEKDPKKTQYNSREVVSKSDPRLLRRAGLDTLLSEVNYIQVKAEAGNWYVCQSGKMKLMSRILHDLVCVEALGEVPINRELDQTIETLQKIHRQCHTMATVYFSRRIEDIDSLELYLLRAHIRETELLCCSEDMNEADDFIQMMLNYLSSVAYVAAWEEQEQKLKQKA